MRFNLEKTLEVYGKKGCNVSSTCMAVGISRMQFYRMKAKSKKFAEGLKEIEESMIDNVESKLLSKIHEGDTTALIFFLKTKGKSRGYVERTEVDAQVEVKPVRIMLPSNNRDESSK